MGAGKTKFFPHNVECVSSNNWAPNKNHYNAKEGFQRGFESMLQINKTDIWTFLKVIHKQQAFQEYTVAQQKGESR